MTTRTPTFVLGALVLAFAATACDGLPSGDKRSVEYWGDATLEMYGDELEYDELEPGPEPLEEPRTVLLITGVTIRAEWFDPMVARLERDGFRPVVYEPPDLLSGDLFENSELLAEVVEDIVAETGEPRIDILAECTGGLIARHYIQSHGGDRYVSRLVTFISPQHGVDKAPLAAEYAGWPALYDLSPGSEFLSTVNSAPLPENVPVTSIYSCTDEYIQPHETSIIPGATNIGLCDEPVGHFEFFYDPDLYLIMHAALTEPVPPRDGVAPDDGLPIPEGEMADDAPEPAAAATCSAAGSAPALPAALPFLAVAVIVLLRSRHPRRQPS